MDRSPCSTQVRHRSRRQHHAPWQCCRPLCSTACRFAFDDHVVLRDVSFSVPKGSMKILLGPSGAGKSVVLKLILGLLRPDSGTILVNGRHIENMTERDLMGVRADIGMMFQENALFDSLTVAENVGYRLYEETDMPLDQVRRRVEEVLGSSGSRTTSTRMPSELSGGQRRRVAVARAMAAKPSLLLFDDPTSGLDPITAATVDDQIVKLRDLEHVTSIVVTHQMRDAFYVASHEAARSTDRRASSDRRSGGGARMSASWCSTRGASGSTGTRRSCGIEGRLPAALPLQDASALVTMETTMDAVKSADGPAKTTPFGEWAADGRESSSKDPTPA